MNTLTPLIDFRVMLERLAEWMLGGTWQVGVNERMEFCWRCVSVLA